MSDTGPATCAAETSGSARPRPRSRRKWLWAAGASLAVLLVIGAGAAWRMRGRDTDAAGDLLRSARSDLAAHRLTEAREQLKAVLDRWPLDPEAHFLLARSSRRMDDLPGWQEHLHAAAVLGWPPSDLEREQLFFRAQTGDVWATEAKLLPMLPAADDNAVLAVEALCKGYLATYRLDDLLEYVQGWIDRRPDDWPAYYLRGQAYAYGRLLARAIDDYRRVVDLRPDHADARLRLAGAYMVEGQFEQAQAEYEKYLASHPPVAEALYGLANCQLSLARPADARATLDRLFALDPNHPVGCFIRAKMDMPTDPAAALEWLRKAERQSPNETDLTDALVRVLNQLGRPEEAAKYQKKLDDLRADNRRLDELRKQVRNEPDKAALRRDIGQLCVKLGKRDEAVSWFESVLRLDPSDAATHRALADLFEQAGDPRAAFHRARAGAASAPKK